MVFLNKTLIILGAISFLGLAALGVGLGYYFSTSSTTLYRGGVVTNGHECAGIGASILKKGGSAADAAIAALFCEGVAMPQSMGLGGGFLMTLYEKSTGKTFTLNAREQAPRKAFKDMFKKNASLATTGGLAVAIPSELKGYSEVHRKFGKLPWKEVVRPTIELCKKGHLVTPYLAKLLKSQEANFKKSPTLKDIYINKETQTVYKEGDLLKRNDMVKFLEDVAEEGGEILYSGRYAKSLVDDINNLGGNMTVEDMKDLKVEWMEPIKVKMPFGQTLYTVNLPGSGVILAFIMNILKGFIDISAPNSVQTTQRIIESFKYGYGRRTELGDPHFVDVKQLLANLTSESYALEIRNKIKDNWTSQNATYYGANFTITEDHGTAHLCVIAPNGDAVSVTSTVNLYFGAKVRSVSTGIILNNEMDDFSSPNIINSFGMPPSPANYIAAGKRPLSSMVPTIVIDGNKDVRLVIGSAGGTKITTSVALVTIKHLWFNQTIKDAVHSRRFHHQLFPMRAEFEHGYDEAILAGIGKIGHNYTAEKTDGFASLTALSRKDFAVDGSHDPRRAGSVVLVE